MTLPKGFRPKDTKKSKTESSKGSSEKNDKDNNINADSSQINVTKATANDIVNKQEKKIVADNIPQKQEVIVDDVRIEEGKGTATVTTVTTTPTSEGEVLSETELKVPLQEKEKEVLSETELKVMPSSQYSNNAQSSSRSLVENETASSPPTPSRSTRRPRP